MADRDERLKNAGKFLTKVGAQIAETAKVAGVQIAETAKVAGVQIAETAKVAGTQVKQTAKQVTGLGRGSVKLELDQTKAAPGAPIQGRVVLALGEPVEAKRLVVLLRARQKLVTVGRQGGSRTVGTSHADVYELAVELGGARSYQSQTVPFELTVPPDALELKAAPPATPLGEAVRSVAAALSPTAGPIEWQVVGRLEIAWGRDLASEVDIVVSR